MSEGAKMPEGRGIVVVGAGDKAIQAKAKRAKLPVTIGKLGPPPYEKTLFVAPGTEVPWDLLPAAWHFLERWDAAVPLWRYGVNAADVGTPSERKRTETIVRDLRVLLHSHELLFVRKNDAGSALMAAFVEELGGQGSERTQGVRGAGERGEGVPLETLNVGAGNHIWNGAVNHDLRKHRPEIDVAHDLNDLLWPWEDGSFDQIGASSVFEHLAIDLVTALDECWRILRPGGTLRVKLPHWKHDNAYADPTHRWRYSLRALNVFDPETKLGTELGFYTERKWSFVAGPKLNDQKSSIIATLGVRK